MMKRILITVVLTLLWVPGLFAMGIDFFHGTWEEAKMNAKEENKLIFVDAYTTWCGPCKWMSANTFPNEEVGKFFNKNFINMKLDMEKEGDGANFAKEFNIRAFPTLLFIDGEGNLMHQTARAMDPESFIALGKTALDPEARFANYEQKYRNGDRDVEFIRDYLNVLALAYMDTKEVADWYFSTQSDQELLTNENFDLISKLVQDANQPIFKFVFRNQDKFKTVTKPDVIDIYINQVFKRTLLRENNKGEDAYKKAVENVRTSGYDQADRVISEVDIERELNKKDFETFTKKVIRHVKMYEWDNPDNLNQYAWRISQIDQINQEEVIEEAKRWVERAMELDNNYKANHIYAELLYKEGKNKSALKAANKALEMAQAQGTDMSRTLTLIERINNDK